MLNAMPTKLNKDEAVSLIKGVGLRVTATRIVVLQSLAAATQPLSHSDLVAALGQTSWDSSTTFRTLKTLVEEGLAVVASRIDGIDRYSFSPEGQDSHAHAHFVCNDCGEVSCLPESLQPKVDSEDPWAASLKNAQIQLRGECPDCIDEPAETNSN